MSAPDSPGNVEAHIHGDVSGQVAIGNYIVQIGAVHGGVVNIAMPEQGSQPRPRPVPVSILPRQFSDMLDRHEEVENAAKFSRSGRPTEFHGPAGQGKTALMRCLAHQRPTDEFSDGVVYTSIRRQAPADFLQNLYDYFYETDIRFKPTEAQISHALRDKRVLLLLDDVEIARDDVEALMDVMPASTFILASPERRLWGEGHSAPLGGLPGEDALRLLERELGRPLFPEDRPHAAKLCSVLNGHPLRILQAAALAREDGIPLLEVLQRVSGRSSEGALAGPLLESLSEAERQLLMALAALGGGPVHVDRLAALTGIANAGAELKELEQRFLTESHSPRYSLTGELGDIIEETWDVNQWRESALSYFVGWAESLRGEPDQVVEEADVILHLLGWASEAGRWTEVLRLGRAFESALALVGRWDAWARVLSWILRAAKAIGNQADEAWALHQIGTRSLCLEDVENARSTLTEALRMREEMGDHAGAEVTRHNLDLLAGPPAGPPREPDTPSTGGPRLLRWLIPLAVVAVGVLVAVLVWPPSPVAEVGIWLEGGCDSEYVIEDQTTLVVDSNIAGTVQIWLDERLVEKVRLSTGETWETLWAFGGIHAGEHLLHAALLDDRGSVVATDECIFALAGPGREPTEPAPEAEVSIWLEAGCDKEYSPGDQTILLVEASVAGSVEIWLDRDHIQEIFLERVAVWEMPWSFQEIKPGKHALRVSLVTNERGERVAANCWFFVGESAPPPVPSAPDLVAEFEVVGEPKATLSESITLPIRVVVINQGGEPAGRFKVAAEYAGPDGEFVTAFTVPGQTDKWYPHTDRSLAAGDTVSFEGNVIFPPSLWGRKLKLWVTADSCSGDEFMPDYCRVEESDEANNRSAAIELAMP